MRYEDVWRRFSEEETTVDPAELAYSSSKIKCEEVVLDAPNFMPSMWSGGEFESFAGAGERVGVFESIAR